MAKKCFTQVLFIHIIMLLFIGITSAQTISPAKFTAETLFNLQWGKEAGNAGIIHDPGENFGPQSFEVDAANNKIYILDRGH